MEGDDAVANYRNELMAFGSRIRELRQAKILTFPDVAKKVKGTFNYVSKIENQKVSFGEFPSDDLIVRLARVLDGDSDELLIHAEKIPDAIRKRVFQRYDVFRRLSGLDGKKLDTVLEFLELHDTLEKGSKRANNGR